MIFNTRYYSESRGLRGRYIEEMLGMVYQCKNSNNGFYTTSIVEVPQAA